MSLPPPGKKAVLTYTLSDGLEFLLPRPPKKPEPPEEQKGEEALNGALLLLRDVGTGAGLEGSLQQPWWELCAVVSLSCRSQWGEEALAQ